MKAKIWINVVFNLWAKLNRTKNLLIPIFRSNLMLTLTAFSQLENRTYGRLVVNHTNVDGAAARMHAISHELGSSCMLEYRPNHP